ncbi:MAG: hypothetical protein R3A45_06850 [Bdellovibrionota bacterium]
MAAILTSLEPFDVLFIDEIHRLNRTVEEILIKPWKTTDLISSLGRDLSAKTVKIDISPFPRSSALPHALVY